MNRLRRFLARPVHGPTVVRTLLALVVVGAVAGAATVGLGLYNVSARLGHLPGVGWVLHTTFRNSIEFYSGSVTPPKDLRSADRVALGAGHFDTGCRPCHGAPGQERQAMARHMNPEPPHVAEIADRWDPDEFHWIVHEGAKMTGMPAWPARRKDDVWPVVAFLMESGTMTGEDYDRLTERPQDQYCAMCHGLDGVSGNPHIPRLDIQSEPYLATALRAYNEGFRDSGIMRQAATQVSAESLDRLAARFAALDPSGEGRPLDSLAEEGRRLAMDGGPDDVPACRACHGPWPEPLNPAFPSLAGQYEPYLGTQLRLWREGNRGGGVAADLMHHAAADLTDHQIAALSAYYAALAPAKLNDTADPRDAR